MTRPTLHVRIVSPKGPIFQGEVLSVSSINSKGPFDILPLHANFVTLIENQPIKIRTPDKKSVAYTFPLAIVYARTDAVDIYTDIQISL